MNGTNVSDSGGVLAEPECSRKRQIQFFKSGRWKKYEQSLNGDGPLLLLDLSKCSHIIVAWVASHVLCFHSYTNGYNTFVK